MKTAFPDKGDAVFDKKYKKKTKNIIFFFLLKFLCVILLKCDKMQKFVLSQDKLSFNLYKWRA